MQTEILIVKNPLFYQHVAPDAYQALIGDGSWIPLVFGAIEAVVQRRFFQLCELDWDYLRDDAAKLAEPYSNYKTLYFRGLNEEQRKFAEQVADEIEEEIRANAAEALAAKEAEELE
ncbi:MAG: hypothetical protein IKU86_07095 [Thermoguttaceae bacterium]|nr:hypothetical protein [Thermoguttaceae bacterium]